MEEMEEKKDIMDLIDDSPENLEIIEVPKQERKSRKEPAVKEKKEKVVEKDYNNCLRRERVIVRYLMKEDGLNPKHPLHGGMLDGAVKVYTVPRLSSGTLVNVLTDAEKAFLEEVMGLDDNALSIYRKGDDNYWNNLFVRLQKGDNYLNLWVPDDYIKYKVLLANRDYIAPSMDALHDAPKATYKFVIIHEGEETKAAGSAMEITAKCYYEYGAIKDDTDTMRVIIETIEGGKPVAANTKKEILQNKLNSLIQADSRTFLKVITDEYLPSKVLIKKGLETGAISKRGAYYYIRKTNEPMCSHNQDPTLSVAARWLNLPENREIKDNLEEYVKNI